MPGAARRRAQVLLPRRRVASLAEFSHRTGSPQIRRDLLAFLIEFRFGSVPSTRRYVDVRIVSDPQILSDH